jgi:hypothetical protein
MALNPLSHILNQYELKGYKLKDGIFINHLLYMDDLKVYANNKTNLKVLLDSVEIFTEDIGMTFGLDKCNILHLTAGRRDTWEGNEHSLINGQVINQLQIDQNYKYLGIYESGKIQHEELRQQFVAEYVKRIKKLTNTQLNARNLIKGINSYAIPVLLYSFGIINYKNNDLKQIDRKTRKLLNLKKAHQQKADVERLYMPVDEGGRGLINVELLYKKQILKYDQYLSREQDHLIKSIRQHDVNKVKYSISKEAREIVSELQLPQGNNLTDAILKKAILDNQNRKWREKQLHGQYPRAVLDLPNIDKGMTFKWIKKCHISPSLESSLFVIQDQSIMTKQFIRDIARQPSDGKCRLCGQKDETVQHIVSGCEKLAGTLYIKRHNNLVEYVHWCLAKKHGIDVAKLWWKEKLTQPKVTENETTKLLWEIPIQTDSTITHNRPDIIYINKTDNMTYLIDITVPSDYNIGPKEIEKLSKYHPLRVEITRMWNTRTKVIPIVVGATGTVAKNLKTYTDELDAGIRIDILQKQAAIHTIGIIGKVLGGGIVTI